MRLGAEVDFTDAGYRQFKITAVDATDAPKNAAPKLR
jgi:hypothetical protein